MTKKERKEIEAECLRLHKKIIEYQNTMHEEAGMPEHWKNHPLHEKHFNLIYRHLKLSQSLKGIDVDVERRKYRSKLIKRFPRLATPMRFPRLRFPRFPRLIGEAPY